MADILFDARVVRPGMTGIGNYTRNVLRALPANRGRIGVILPAGSPYAGDFPGCTIHFTRLQPDSHPLTEIFEQVLVPMLCKRYGYSAFVAIGGPVPAIHPGIKVYPFVHDLAFLRVKGSHNRRYSLLLRLNLWIMRRFATVVITVSETARGHILSLPGLERARTAVVHPADSRLDAAEPRVVPIGRPYFLAVSLTNRRKNISTLLEGFAKFNAARGNAYALVLTGNEKLIRDALARGENPDAVNLGFVSDGELRFLYEHATALIYASLDEGFGMPLLDAARLKCPVVCSDIPVFREVAGSYARYFDPLSGDSLASALASEVEDPVKRPGDALSRFSWENTAKRLWEVVNAA